MFVLSVVWPSEIQVQWENTGFAIMKRNHMNVKLATRNLPVSMTNVNMWKFTLKMKIESIYVNIVIRVFIFLLLTEHILEYIQVKNHTIVIYVIKGLGIKGICGHICRFTWELSPFSVITVDNSSDGIAIFIVIFKLYI